MAESIQRWGIEPARNVGTAQVGGNATFPGAACQLAAKSEQMGGAIPRILQASACRGHCAGCVVRDRPNWSREGEPGVQL